MQGVDPYRYLINLQGVDPYRYLTNLQGVAPYRYLTISKLNDFGTKVTLVVKDLFVSGRPTGLLSSELNLIKSDRDFSRLLTARDASDQVRMYQLRIKTNNM